MFRVFTNHDFVPDKEYVDRLRYIMVFSGHYVEACEQNPISCCRCVQLPFSFNTGGSSEGGGGKGKVWYWTETGVFYTIL